MENIMIPTFYKILSVTKETVSEYTFRVCYDKEVKHGQFFMLSIPKVGEAPISVSAMGDGWIEFTIRKVGKLTEGIFGLEAGETIFMRGPYGNSFPLEKFKGKHLLVIAGGTGMAAVRSTLFHYEENPGELESLSLIAGFRDISTVLFTDDLKRFASCFTTHYTLDSTADAGSSDSADLFKEGFVTGYIDKVPIAGLSDYNIVIVGPPAMMSASVKKCIESGAAEEKIWLSLERKMSCAVGKCGHCKINETYVCLEGPVLNYSDAKNLID